MFDREFFEKTLPVQVTELTKHGDGVCTVEVDLLDVSYKIVRLIAAGSGSVVLEVYPHGGKTPKKHSEEDRAAGAPQFQFDRVAVAYGAIIKVVLTLSPPSSGIGFHL